jgi:hypothetical protein
MNSINDNVDSLAPSIHSRTPLMIAVENRLEEILCLLMGIASTSTFQIEGAERRNGWQRQGNEAVAKLLLTRELILK